MRISKFIQYLKSEPWWEKKISDMEAYRNGWVADYHGCVLPESYGKLPHKLAHIITAWLSAFGITDDGKILRGNCADQLYSPAATFHMWHKRLGGHGQGAY
jgi:hypothetical protein